MRSSLAHELGGDEPLAREYDALLSTGEQKTIALLAMAISQLGQSAQVLHTAARRGSGPTTRILRARIASIDSASDHTGCSTRESWL